MRNATRGLVAQDGCAQQEAEQPLVLFKQSPAQKKIDQSKSADGQHWLLLQQAL